MQLGFESFPTHWTGDVGNVLLIGLKMSKLQPHLHRRIGAFVLVHLQLSMILWRQKTSWLG